MERVNFIYFMLGVFSLAVGFIAKPYVDTLVSRITRLFTREKQQHQCIDPVMLHNMEVLVERMNDLETQINNVAERLSNRDANRRNNIRRDVREYLKELQK